LPRGGGEGYRPRTVAKEARKLRRGAQARGGEGKRAKKELSRPLIQQAQAPVDPFGRAQLRAMGWRLGLPVAGVWLVGVLIWGVSHTPTVQWIALGLPGAVTAALLGLVGWALHQARKAKAVHGILSKVRSAEDREAALGELGTKKKDATATFAKAQLLMQQDPKKALSVLEELDLNKLMAPMADEARAQRAMIHLMLGEVSKARPLADGIDLSRHQEPKTRAMMAAVVGEAWARTGQAKKALETLKLIDPDDREYEQLKPQLYRALAHAYAHTDDFKGMRRSLKKLLDQDVRLLGGFLGKRTHPVLLKEAKKLVMQSGQVPQKMVVQRR
jgi:hypothetical protein